MLTTFRHATRPHAHHKNAPKIIGAIDDLSYLMGVITVLVNLPQLYAVWTSPTVAGVSIISWFGFFLGSLFWLFYGLLHREKPIIIMNGALLFVQGLIVIGLLRH